MGDHLPNSKEMVRKLQRSLEAKAKTEPGYRFYSLWDKVCREDVLREAYRRCRRNGGAPGVDRETFEQIETGGLETWLGNLREELRLKKYQPQPLLRVWIPKANGGQRPLGIPTVRDRVAQAAVVTVLGPIVETDLLNEQFGFRPGRDAKVAVRMVYYQLRQKGRQEVVDADLSDYFNRIPHGALMRCLSRRIVDGQMLATIRAWLRAPVVEEESRGHIKRSTQAKDENRGTPQGGVISPLLANLYFRRFLLAWEKFGCRQRHDSVVVNYADDFVICCRNGKGQKAMESMKDIMDRFVEFEALSYFEAMQV
jgi:group II intron reverse transcriptase/maturase